jgi:acyl carrier protein
MIYDTFQDTISSWVEQIIQQQTDSNEELTPETDLLIDLAIDSLEMVELGLKIEKQFGAKLPIADLRGCTTVGELVELTRQVNSAEVVAQR